MGALLAPPRRLDGGHARPSTSTGGPATSPPPGCGQESLLAGDLVDALPDALRSLATRSRGRTSATS